MSAPPSIPMRTRVRLDRSIQAIAAGRAVLDSRNRVGELTSEEPRTARSHCDIERTRTFPRDSTPTNTFGGGPDVVLPLRLAPCCDSSETQSVPESAPMAYAASGTAASIAARSTSSVESAMNRCATEIARTATTPTALTRTTRIGMLLQRPLRSGRDRRMRAVVPPISLHHMSALMQ